MLTRAHCASNQAVASWTGFNIRVFDEVEVTPDEVGYESTDLQSLVNTFSLEICHKTFTETLSSLVFLLLAEHFEAYKDSLRQHGGPLASFWMSYLDIMDIMLNMLRASREGNWDLHLSTIHDMISWSFAYDKHNYARYLSTYYNNMTNLS